MINQDLFPVCKVTDQISSNITSNLGPLQPVMENPLMQVANRFSNLLNPIPETLLKRGALS